MIDVEKVVPTTRTKCGESATRCKITTKRYRVLNQYLKTGTETRAEEPPRRGGTHFAEQREASLS